MNIVGWMVLVLVAVMLPRAEVLKVYQFEPAIIVWERR
jgi:hypothetical protein